MIGHDWRNWETCQCRERGCLSSLPVQVRCVQCMQLVEWTQAQGMELAQWQIETYHFSHMDARA